MFFLGQRQRINSATTNHDKSSTKPRCSKVQRQSIAPVMVFVMSCFGHLSPLRAITGVLPLACKTKLIRFRMYEQPLCGMQISTRASIVYVWYKEFAYMFPSLVNDISELKRRAHAISCAPWEGNNCQTCHECSHQAGASIRLKRFVLTKSKHIISYNYNILFDLTKLSIMHISIGSDPWI